MAKRNITKGIKERNNVISDEAINTYVANAFINEKKKVLELEYAVGADKCQVLKEMGKLNMQLKDVAILIGIPTNKLKAMIEKGQKDFEDGYISEECEMYMAYQYGLKSLEATAVTSLIKKDPEKLLSKLNPEVYSDNVQDKFVVPAININFGEKKSVDIDALEQSIRADLENRSDEEE